MIRVVLPLSLAAGVLLLSGCGAAPERQPDRATRLTVTVWPRGAGEKSVTRLDCEEPKSAKDQRLCAEVRRVPADVWHPREDLACTAQWGGPAKARVDGQLEGEALTAQFSLRNGCEISRWTALHNLLGDPQALPG